MGHFDSSSPWDKKSLKIIVDRTRYSLFRCKLQKQWQLEWSCPGKELDSLGSLMNTFLINLKESLSVPSYSCIGSWLCFNSVWNTADNLQIFLGLWQFPIKLPSRNLFPKITTYGAYFWQYYSRLLHIL